MVPDYQSQPDVMRRSATRLLRLPSRYPRLTSILGRLANLIIVVLFIRITMVAGGIGTVGFVIENGAPNAWGLQIALSKASIVLLLMAVILPGIRPSSLISLAGCLAIGAAWAAFFNELSFTSQGHFVVDSLPFGLVVLLQVATIFIRLRADFLGIGFKRLTAKDWTSILSAIVICAAAYLCWSLKHAPNFEKQ